MKVAEVVPSTRKNGGKYSDLDKTEDSDEESEIRILTINEAIEEAGGFGKFQMLYVPLAGLGFILNGFFIYNLNYSMKYKSKISVEIYSL